MRCPAALSERRGIINPRRGWQPCVAPYFADLGVGDMRGPPMGAPKMPPRRRWQVVIAPHDPMSHTLIHSTLHATPWWQRQPRTTSGVRFGWDTTTLSPHVATTPRGEIRGYARLPPPPGWRKCSPPVIVSANGGGRALRQTESHEVACLIVTLHLRSCAGVAECLPRLRAEGTPP